MRLDATKKQMTGEYVEGRTELFNQFKKAAQVTAKMQVLLLEGVGYRGTSLIRKCTTPEPYRRSVSRVLGWS